MTIKENRAESTRRFIDFKEIIDDTSLAGIKRTVGAVITAYNRMFRLLDERGTVI